MTDPVNDLLEPWEQRIAAVLEAALDAMPDDLVAECRTLVALDPSVAGIRAHHVDDDVLFTWVGRQVARVNRHWLMTGEAP